MADTTLPALLDTGTHAARPAASAVGTGALYSCTDHGLVYQTDGSSWSTWATLGGDVSAHTGDTSDAHDASAISFTPAGTIAATDVQAAIEEVATEAGSGAAVQQIYAYPTHAALTGDSNHFSALTGWTNEDTAFDTLEILGGSFAHMAVVGASQTSTLRRALSGSYTGAYDFRALLIPDVTMHSADTCSIAFTVKDGSGNMLAGLRLQGTVDGTINRYALRLDVGNPSAFALSGTPTFFDISEPVVLRIVRDGSDNVTYYYGRGTTPGALGRVLDANRVPYTATSATDPVRVEFTMVSPAGPNAAAERHVYLDYFQAA